jgi:hypothetical protein
MENHPVQRFNHVVFRKKPIPQYSENSEHMLEFKLNFNFEAYLPSPEDVGGRVSLTL